MNRIDRALGIVLLLRGGATLSAAELARRFEVSPRTIYRDVDLLAGAGVPIYADQGRRGGFRLVEGYFLPPVMFGAGEASALLLGVALLRRLRAAPFGDELELAERKLLAVLPADLITALERARRQIGIEALPADLLHPEPDDPQLAGAPDGERQHLSVFLRAMLEGRAVRMRYRSPYRSAADGAEHLAPQGLIWDRERWYLVGRRLDDDEGSRIYRADRVEVIAPGEPTAGPPALDPLDKLLGRQWLRPAMETWAAEAPVVIEMGAQQAERLRRDWYYGQARYATLPDGSVEMTFGEEDRATVMALLRWLGPDAELLVPARWREAIRAELQAMLDKYI